MATVDELRQIAAGGLAATNSKHLRGVARAALTEMDSLRYMQHPLGFYHVRLFEQAPVTLRLHYWPKTRRPPTVAVTPYHDHVWALQSCVLVGRIENVVIALEENAAGDYAVADIQQVGGVDAVVPRLSKVTVRVLEVAPQATGDHYSMPPGVFHCTNVESDVAAITFVRAEVLAPGGPRTLVPAGYAGQAPARPYLTDSEANALRSDLVMLLSQPV